MLRVLTGKSSVLAHVKLRRVSVHSFVPTAGELSGREIERALMASASAQKNITFFEHHLATELVWDEVSGVRHCLGADVLDQRALSMTRFVAPVTMLATGGAGQVFSLP